jgi:hypothetical protein
MSTLVWQSLKTLGKGRENTHRGKGKGETLPWERGRGGTVERERGNEHVCSGKEGGKGKERDTRREGEGLTVEGERVYNGNH